MSTENEEIENGNGSSGDGTNFPGITFTPEKSIENNDTPVEHSFTIEDTAVEIDTEEQKNPEEEIVQWEDTSFEELPEFKQEDVVFLGGIDEEDFEDEDSIYVEADEEILFRIIKDKKGLEVDKLDDLLTPKEQKKYSPKMEKFNEFIEKTGIDDYNTFLETQKDWSTEKEDVVLKEYIKLSNPALTDKEVNHLYNKRYNTEGLDEEDDEDEILERGINIKTDLQKANEFFAKRKEEFNVVGGSDEHIPLEYREAKKFFDSQKEQEKAIDDEWNFKRNDFVSKTESLFNSNFEGFKIQLGNEKDGFEEFTIKPENINEVKEFQLDSTNLNSAFFDPKTGELIKPKEYHESQYFARNYKAELNKAYERGRAKELERQDKLSKNVQPDNIKNVPTNGKTGITFTLEKG